MKKILLLITFLTVLLAPGLNAQNDVAYPVDLNVQIIPPYNTCIRDLAPAELSSELGRFRVTMLVRDMSHSHHPFKIRMKVRNTSGQEIFSTISGEIRIQAGYPNLLSSNQLLNEFFAAHNIVSGAGNLKDGCFKEGAYVFAFQAVDGDNPSLPVSREVQCFTFLEKGAPPMLISPSNRSTVQSEGGIVIPFQWQLPYVTNVRETFILEVYEVPEGINPNQVFDNISFRVFAEEDIPMTICFVEKTAGTFEVGKQYAWRVRIKDREAYINNGISEVFTFTYGTAIGTTEPPEVKVEPTLPKVIIDSVGTSSGSAIVYWQNDPANFSGYIVEVRRAGSDAAWTGTSAGYEDYSLVLSNISPKILYEVRVQGLEQQAAGTAYGIYSEIDTFQISFPEEIECGKPLPALKGSTPMAPSLEQYFTFYANGQAVEIAEITLNGDNSFSGTGYIDFPLLKQIKIKVAFTNIQINENNELLSGTVRTIYDESSGLIMDLNRLLNKGDGGTADGPVQPLEKKNYPTKEAALAGLNEGEFGQVAGSDSIFVKTADNKLISVGTVLPSTFKYENTGKLETNIPYIVFSKPEGANLAFDNNSGKYFDNVYRLKDTYEKLNTNYTVPWLAMNPGKIVHLDAAIEGGSLDSVKFIIPLADGTTLQLDHNGTFDVRIPGGSAGTTTEIFALAKVGDANKVVGKLKLANYAAKTQKVNLVPVRRDKGTIDGGKIEEELNRIYGERLGIHFTVTVKERFGEKNAGDPDDELDFLDGGLEVDNKGFWSNETKGMKYLKYLYHEANNIEKDAAYIFVIDFSNRDGVQGDMPRGKQAGYVFCENKETFSDGHLVAHELGHGLYGLQHTFATDYGIPQGTTNNLMDYTPNNEDFLAAWQWKIINNPMIVWNFLEGDEDGMAIDITAEEIVKNFQNLRNTYGEGTFMIIHQIGDIDVQTNVIEEKIEVITDNEIRDFLNIKNVQYHYIGNQVKIVLTCTITEEGQNLDFYSKNSTPIIFSSEKLISDIKSFFQSQTSLFFSSVNDGWQRNCSKYLTDEINSLAIETTYSTDKDTEYFTEICKAVIYCEKESAISRINNFASSIEISQNTITELERLFSGEKEITDDIAGKRHNTKALLFITDETTTENQLAKIPSSKGVIWIHKGENGWELKSNPPAGLEALSQPSISDLLPEIADLAYETLDAYATFWYETYDYASNAVRTLKIPRYAWDDKDPEYNRIYAYAYKGVMTVLTLDFKNSALQIFVGYGLGDAVKNDSPQLKEVFEQIGDGRVEFALVCGVWDGAVETVAGALDIVSIPYGILSEKGRNDYQNFFTSLAEYEEVDEHGNIKKGVWAAISTGFSEEFSTTLRTAHFAGEMTFGVALCFVGNPEVLVTSAGGKVFVAIVKTMQVFDEISGIALKPLGCVLRFMKQAGGKIIGQVLQDSKLLFEVIDDKLVAKGIKKIGTETVEDVNIPIDDINITKVDDKIIVERKSDGSKWELGSSTLIEPKYPKEGFREMASQWIGELKQRFDLADDFYRNAGYTDYDNHLRGIDFDKPVKVVAEPQGNYIYQYCNIDSEGIPIIGDYFYKNPDVDVNLLGFDKGNRKLVRMQLTESVDFLESTTSNIDDWFDTGKVFQGGEIQLFSPSAKTKINPPTIIE